MIPVVLPCQHLLGENGRLLPHKRLMAAVLQTAVDDRWGSRYRRVPRDWTPAEIRKVRLATAYVTSTDRTWPFSFENVCEALGIDPISLRQELQKETARDGTILGVAPCSEPRHATARRNVDRGSELISNR